jgi:hypothetical protein
MAAVEPATAMPGFNGMAVFEPPVFFKSTLLFESVVLRQCGLQETGQGRRNRDTHSYNRTDQFRHTASPSRTDDRRQLLL